MYALKTFSATDIGRKRQINQDYVYCSSGPVGNLPNLFIVCDGMGGHNAGDYASKNTALAIVESIEKDPEVNPIKLIRRAIEDANDKIYAKSMSDSAYNGMGTTAVVATIIEDYLYVANVGDSRLYLIRDDIKQITKDHSLVEEMVRAGEINREEARFHPDKNIITRAVGADRNVLSDVFEVDLLEGDVILMCTDGLSNMVGDSDILAVIKKQKNVDDMATELVRLANHNGGKDNIGVVLVRLEGAN